MQFKGEVLAVSEERFRALANAVPQSSGPPPRMVQSLLRTTNGSAIAVSRQSRTPATGQNSCSTPMTRIVV